MRIEVVGSDAISQQARAYAEYRVFAALAHFAEAEKVSHATVVLRPMNVESGGGGIACTVTVATKGSAPLRIRTSGPHAYAAINRAVERIRAAATTARAEPHVCVRR